MTGAEFQKKWARFQGKESAAYQEHFTDLCHLLGQPTPAEADPSGTESFCFQKRVVKDAELFELHEAADESEPAERGFADVWKKGCFAWEYKGKKKNLDEAFRSKAKTLQEAQAGEHAGDDALKFYTEREWPAADVIVGKHQKGIKLKRLTSPTRFQDFCDFFDLRLTLPLPYLYTAAVNPIAVQWRLTGKNTVDRGRCSRDLRAVPAGRVVWLLPKVLWSFSGGEGGGSGALCAHRGCET